MKGAAAGASGTAPESEGSAAAISSAGGDLECGHVDADEPGGGAVVHADHQQQMPTGCGLIAVIVFAHLMSWAGASRAPPPSLPECRWSTALSS